MTSKNPILQKLGGHFQLKIENADDLSHLCQLDEAHWMATIVPTDSLKCNEAFIKNLDSDGSGSIRSEELKDAWVWVLSVLSETSGITNRKKELNLNWINLDSEKGKAIYSTALQVLANLGIEGEDKITLEQIKSRSSILALASNNGDGVIPPECIEDNSLRTFINNVMKTCGQTKDLSGKEGVNEKILCLFESKLKAYSEWHEKGLIPDDASTTHIMIRGKDTASHASVIAKLENKLDEYFRLCRLVRIDPPSEKRFNTSSDKLPDLDLGDAAAIDDFLNKALIAKPNPDEVLLLHGDINPLYTDSLKSLFKTCFNNEHQDSLSRTEWENLKLEFTSYRNWVSAKSGSEVEPLGLETIQSYLEGKEIVIIRDLIEADKAVEKEIAGIADLEKLLLLQANLLDLANNFISLNQLFDPASDSLIQIGKLIMNGRHFDFCVRVTDRNKHRKIADQSNICTLYIECRRKNGEAIEKMDVAAAVTSGNMSYLFIGKLGVFFDTEGQKWDAEVIDMVIHPVSISEALKIPFVKLGEFLKKQTDKFTSNRYEQLESNLGKKWNEAEQKLDAPPTPTANVPTGLKTSNLSFLMLGGGLSLAALSSAFGYLTKTLKGVSISHVLMVVISIFLVVAAPFVILALIKLQKRNLGIFLEAGGWAINAPLRLTRRMGLLFTHVPDYPKGSQFRRFDLIRPLLKKTSFKSTETTIWFLIVIIVLVIVFFSGYILS